uniref:MAR-binding filament-like protein 1 n=1 Tax=Noccaea caerulescens TaxID=107243 RepID=A0A1J3I9R4_NOCCA
MATTTTISSFSLSLPQVLRNKLTNPSPFLYVLPRFNSRFRTLTLTASAATSSNSSNRDDGFSLDDFTLHSDSRSPNPSKKCVLSDLIQEIEPLDVSLIQKDVPITTLDAMKRTISGMLGLLPSDRFQVHIESLWEPLSKLLVSSMMTGYTLRNAEYRLFLEKNLDMHGEDLESHTSENTECDLKGTFPDDTELSELFDGNNVSSTKGSKTQSLSEMLDKEGLGRVSSEAQEYIFRLQSQLSSVKKELQEVRRKNAALQMQQFVGEEKNDLLDYLRSLQPEKVAELSEPAAPEVKETIHSVVHGLLATLSPKMHSKLPPSEGPPPTETVISKSDEDCAELVENTSLHFQPLISLTRDYLARLLFWCMLLGHYLRGLEYRMELMEVLSLTCDADGSENVA